MKARVVRCVDGIEMDLFAEALRLRREQLSESQAGRIPV